MRASPSNEKNLIRQQVALASFGELALRSDDLDEILNEACRLVGEALGTDLAKVVELGEDGRTLMVRAGVGWKPGVVGVATITLADNTSESMAIKTGAPVISPDIEKETRFRYPTFLTENGVRAVANVPIIGGKDRPPYGILQVDSREPRLFTENDTTFLSGYANLLAAAVDRLRVLAQLRVKEAQLRQAQKLEAIGRLAAGVAHDFNNILQGVTGGLELVLDNLATGTATHEFAEVALSSAKRGASLTHQLLSYARLQMLQPRPLEVAPFLTDMMQLLARTLGPQVVVDIRSDHDLPRINADLVQLQTALLNLAINASHAMPGGGALTLSAHLDRDHPDRVIIGVTDTGAGMDEPTLAQAFEPFFTTKGLDGSGLGLSMVQGFAEQSGGEAHIESTPGKGTKVELWLPVVPRVPAKPDESEGIPINLHGSGRILLVDDIADVRLTMGVFLERAGFQVVQAGSGDQALALVAAGDRFDALVCDFAMPGMNGVELLRSVRRVQPGLPALITTGFAEAAGTETLPQEVEVLRKPFTRRQLIEAVLRAMEHKAGPGQSGLARGGAVVS